MASCAPLAGSVGPSWPGQDSVSGRVRIRNSHRGVGILSEADLGGGQPDEEGCYGRGREKSSCRGQEGVKESITNGSQGRYKSGVQIETKKRIMTDRPGKGQAE